MLQDHLPPERGVEWRLPDTEVDLGFEELPLVSVQVDHSNRRLAQLGGGLRDVVEVLLTRRVEQAIPVVEAQVRGFILACAGEDPSRNRLERSGWCSEMRWRAAKKASPDVCLDGAGSLRSGDSARNQASSVHVAARGTQSVRKALAAVEEHPVPRRFIVRSRRHDR